MTRHSQDQSTHPAILIKSISHDILELSHLISALNFRSCPRVIDQFWKNEYFPVFGRNRVILMLTVFNNSPPLPILGLKVKQKFTEWKQWRI